MESNTTKRRLVGILGGTFDPIHYGHLGCARAAYESLGLDEVWLVPTGRSYFKTRLNLHVSEPEHRLAMTKLAAEGVPYLRVSDIEMQREGDTYTADTLRILTEAYPDTDFYYIVGADTLIHMGSWHDPEGVFSRCTIVVITRSDTEEGTLQEAIADLTARFSARIVTVAIENIDISSSEVRRRVEAGESISAMVPAAVEEYIREKKLY